MRKIINIHKKGERIDLTVGSCKIDILGGWGVSLGEFSIQIKDVNTGDCISAKKVSLGVQSYVQKQKAKRIFKIDILQSGTYEIEFSKPETLLVKYSNLPILGIFSKVIPNENLEVCFTN